MASLPGAHRVQKFLLTQGDIIGNDFILVSMKRSTGHESTEHEDESAGDQEEEIFRPMAKLWPY